MNFISSILIKFMQIYCYLYRLIYQKLGKISIAGSLVWIFHRLLAYPLAFAVKLFGKNTYHSDPYWSLWSVAAGFIFRGRCQFHIDWDFFSLFFDIHLSSLLAWYMDDFILRSNQEFETLPFPACDHELCGFLLS